MLYRFVRPLASVALRLHYRRIDLAHTERIPQGAPVILAANHPTAFVEPCILACFLDRPLYFLVRGNIFSKPFYARMLHGLHMLPVFRLRDGGYQNLKQNYDTFAICFQALSRRRTIMILAEGRCIHEKRLRTVQKGTARLALGALENDPLLPEVYIVPVGVNYTYAERTGSEVLIRCGEPILASDYREAYAHNPNAAITELTEVVSARLREHVVHVADPADDALFEQLVQLRRNELPPIPYARILTPHHQQLEAEWQLAEWLNGLPAEEKTPLRELAADYAGRLALLRLNDRALVGGYARARDATAGLLLGLAPMLALAVWHLPPLLLGVVVASVRVKSEEFFTSVKLGIWIGAYLLYALLWLVGGLVLGAWVALGVAAAALLAMPWAIRYVTRAGEWMLAWRRERQDPEVLDQLLALRKKLWAQMAGG